MKVENFTITWGLFPNPCYNPQDAYGECPATMLDLLNDRRIPANDRIWAFGECTAIPDNVKRLAAVRIVRETPLPGGRFVADLIPDERGRKALEVAEKHALGKATDQELKAACDAAVAAARAARAAADAAYAAYAAARAARAAADAAYAAVAAADGSAYAAYAAYACTARAAVAAAAAAYADAAVDAAAAQIEVLISMIEQ